MLAIRKPRLQEPCRMPLMNPRERAGQDSMARAAPAGHSPPMPRPSRPRKMKRTVKVGEKPAAKLQIEYSRIDTISGVLRPIRSAIQPEVTAPNRRSHSVTDSTKATSVSGTLNSLEMGTMISRNMVKSNASSVQPSQPAIHAIHWSFVGSRHQGTVACAWGHPRRYSSDKPPLIVFLFSADGGCGVTIGSVVALSALQVRPARNGAHALGDSGAKDAAGRDASVAAGTRKGGA